MFNSKLLGVCFICAMAMSLNAQAKLYKWVDNNGTTHYGEVIPPEYANNQRDTMTKSGQIEKRPEKADPATIRAKEEAAQKRKVENQAVVEQQRRDSALLNTYSNEKEIDQARERSVVLINARIDSNKMLLQSSQSSLEDLKKEAENRTKSGKKIPASLVKDISLTKERAERYAAELAKSQEELTEVGTRFDNDKALYRKLKSGK
jgi:hypothetical protein